MSGERTMVSSECDAGSTRSAARDLGAITSTRLAPPQTLQEAVGFDGDAVDYYRFELSESREVRVGLKLRSGDADLYLEDAAGNVLSRSMAFGTHEAVVRTVSAGTYYVRVVPVGTQGSEYEFKYGTLEADTAWHPERLLGGVAERMGMPSFAASSYGFALSENADGSLDRVSLGTVTATDPNGESLSYRLVGGNESGLFAIDASSGEVFYVGSGEDFESGSGPYELTVRAIFAVSSRLLKECAIGAEYQYAAKLPRIIITFRKGSHDPQRFHHQVAGLGTQRKLSSPRILIAVFV